MILIPESEYKQLKRKASVSKLANDEEDKTFLQNIAGLLLYAVYNKGLHKEYDLVVKHAKELGYDKLSIRNVDQTVPLSEIKLRYERRGKVTKAS